MPPPIRMRAPFSPQLDLPPPFRALALREHRDAFREAQRLASQEGAGTLVWVGRFDLVEFAVVLEPDEPLQGARRAFFAGCVALADALAVHAPPEKPIVWEWPDAIRVDGGLVGGTRLAWPPSAPEHEPPPWLVFGATIRIVAMTDREPGLRPLSAALAEEGFDDLVAGQLIESFARHLMVAIDAWQESGFSTVGQAYLSRLAGMPNTQRSIDAVGNLLVRNSTTGQLVTRALLPALADPSWLDATTGAPRL